MQSAINAPFVDIAARVVLVATHTAQNKHTDSRMSNAGHQKKKRERIKRKQFHLLVVPSVTSCSDYITKPESTIETGK